MIRLHAPIYLLVALVSTVLAVWQPVEAGPLDARTMVAVTHQVLSSLAMEDASGTPAQAE